MHMPLTATHVLPTCLAILPWSGEMRARGDEGHEGDEGDEGGRGHEMRAVRAMRALRSRRDEGDEDDDEGDGRQLGGFVRARGDEGD